MGSGWQAIAHFILRQRIMILIVIGLLTAFMWFNRSTERVHDFAKIISQNDPDYIEYQDFKQEFGEDGNVFVIGISGDIYSKDMLNMIWNISDTLLHVDGIQEVLSLTHLYKLEKNTDEKRFDQSRLLSQPLETQAQADSLKQVIQNLKFYRNLIVSPGDSATVIAVTIYKNRLDSEDKETIIDNIIGGTEFYAAGQNVNPHYGGLPYVRYYTIKNLPKEMTIFLLLALAITALALFFFFRSYLAVLFPLLIVGIVIIWSLGLLGLLGYKITILSAVIPALITVIGIPNSIYLLTKYHFEFKKTGNKIKSLVLVIQKIGIVTVMTNATTAVGFLVLAITDIQILKEFGIVAGLSVIVTFFVSLFLIPVIFSFLPAPGQKQIKHIDARLLNGVIRFIDRSVHNRRPVIYGLTLGLVALSFWGLGELKPISFMVDDIPKDDDIYTDLKFFESNFSGVMPFEIVIDTKSKNGILRRTNLRRIEKLQNEIEALPELSKTISIVDGIKFARQEYFGGDESQYVLPDREELNLVLEYLSNSDDEGDEQEENLMNSITNEDMSKARIKGNIADIGSDKMKEVIHLIQAKIDTIFQTSVPSGELKAGEAYRVNGDSEFEIAYEGKTYVYGDTFVAGENADFTTLDGQGRIVAIDGRYDTKITGTTKIFIKGNQYLIENLIQSLIIAFVIIAFLMALLFGSPKMVLISLLPNFLPLLLTAAIMGFAGIHLKPSTALIFSVAFGIAVDDTIHYLARFRLARKTGDNVPDAVSNSFKDTGVSMIYTSIILFFGFVIFSWSSFGGTKALGELTSITLLIALFSNLLLLPSLLISLNKKFKPFRKKGIMDFEDEEENVEAIKDLISSDDNEEDTIGEKSVR